MTSVSSINSALGVFFAKEYALRSPIPSSIDQFESKDDSDPTDHTTMSIKLLKQQLQSIYVFNDRLSFHSNIYSLLEIDSLFQKKKPVVVEDEDSKSEFSSKKDKYAKNYPSKVIQKLHYFVQNQYVSPKFKFPSKIEVLKAIVENSKKKKSKDKQVDILKTVYGFQLIPLELYKLRDELRDAICDLIGKCLQLVHNLKFDNQNDRKNHLKMNQECIEILLNVVQIKHHQKIVLSEEQAKKDKFSLHSIEYSPFSVGRMNCKCISSLLRVLNICGRSLKNNTLDQIEVFVKTALFGMNETKRILPQVSLGEIYSEDDFESISKMWALAIEFKGATSHHFVTTLQILESMHHLVNLLNEKTIENVSRIEEEQQAHDKAESFIELWCPTLRNRRSLSGYQMTRLFKNLNNSLISIMTHTYSFLSFIRIPTFYQLIASAFILPYPATELYDSKNHVLSNACYNEVVPYVIIECSKLLSTLLLVCSKTNMFPYVGSFSQLLQNLFKQWCDIPVSIYIDSKNNIQKYSNCSINRQLDLVCYKQILSTIDTLYQIMGSSLAVFNIQFNIQIMRSLNNQINRFAQFIDNRISSMNIENIKLESSNNTKHLKKKLESEEIHNDQLFFDSNLIHSEIQKTLIAAKSWISIWNNCGSFLSNHNIDQSQTEILSIVIDCDLYIHKIIGGYFMQWEQIGFFIDQLKDNRSFWTQLNPLIDTLYELLLCSLMNGNGLNTQSPFIQPSILLFRKGLSNNTNGYRIPSSTKHICMNALHVLERELHPKGAPLYIPPAEVISKRFEEAFNKEQAKRFSKIKQNYYIDHALDNEKEKQPEIQKEEVRHVKKEKEEKYEKQDAQNKQSIIEFQMEQRMKQQEEYEEQVKRTKEELNFVHESKEETRQQEEEEDVLEDNRPVKRRKMEKQKNEIEKETKKSKQVHSIEEAFEENAQNDSNEENNDSDNEISVNDDSDDSDLEDLDEEQLKELDSFKF